MIGVVNENIIDNAGFVYKSIVTEVCDRLGYGLLPYFSHEMTQWSYGGDWATLKINYRNGSNKSRINMSNNVLTVVCTIPINDSPLSMQNINYRYYINYILTMFACMHKIIIKCELRKK